MTYENTNVYWCYNIHYEKTSSNISAKRLRPDQILSTRNGNTGLIHVSVYCRYCGEGKADRCPLCEEDQRAGASPLCLQSASDNRRSCSRKASLLYFLQSHRVISFHFRYNCLTFFSDDLKHFSVYTRVIHTSNNDAFLSWRQLREVIFPMTARRRSLHHMSKGGQPSATQKKFPDCLCFMESSLVVFTCGHVASSIYVYLFISLYFYIYIKIFSYTSIMF